ncbi:MAG: alkaline phosphatase family protein [Peptococcaceae bacterium]|nr:alkaline phosphatase family protein [Peptococcaceae bacterium]
MKREPISSKILVLGVDAMDPRLTRKYVDKGLMPNVKKYIERGACREDLVLLGGHPTVTPAMWTTLAHGCYANVHGITAYYRRPVDKTIDLATVEYNFDSRLCTAEPIWNCLAEAGKKTLVWHWPGSSWPPTSENENLYVVDGTSPGSVGMSTATIENEFIFSAKSTIEEATIIKSAATDGYAPCVVENMVVDEVGYTTDDWVAKYVTRVVTREDQLEHNLTEDGLDLHTSPIKEPRGWAEVPEGAKEAVLLCASGLIRYPMLILKNAAGIYDKVALYKSKKDEVPFVVLEQGKMAIDILGESIKNDQKYVVNRNFKLLKITEDGNEITMYISSAMETYNDSVWSPKRLHKEITENVGFMKPVSYVGCQDKVLISDCMLDSWSVVGDWQAASILHLIEKENLDVVFSHYHNIDIEEHKFIKHLAEKDFNRLPHEAYEKFLEDVYVQTDNYLGKFLHLLDEGWSIMILSDHAQVAPKHDVHVISEVSSLTAGVMKELGFTVLKKDENGNEIAEVDWEKTRAVSVRECNIYINLKGREPYGCVDPADQYELEEEIMTALYGYRDPKTGHRIVSVALRNRDAVLLGYGGPECGDICYWMAEGYNTDHADCLSTTYGEADTSVSPIFIAAGAGFKEGFYTDRIIRQIDVAPTVAVMAGVRMPAQCEGAPIYQIFAEEF